MELCLSGHPIGAGMVILRCRIVRDPRFNTLMKYSILDIYRAFLPFKLRLGTSLYCLLSIPWLDLEVTSSAKNFVGLQLLP